MTAKKQMSVPKPARGSIEGMRDSRLYRRQREIEAAKQREPNDHWQDPGHLGCK